MKEKSLIIQCSNLCPCCCPGCYNFFSNKQISSKDIDDFVVVYKDMYDLHKVTLSGGDPLLRNDISTIINNMLKRELSITIDTVGTTLLNPMRKELFVSLEKIDFLGLPLDGVCDQTIQFFRQHISFQQCLKIIERAKQIGVSICINTVAHAKNLEDIPKIGFVINNETCIHKWQIFQFMPIGPGGFANKLAYSIRNEDFNSLLESIGDQKYRNSLTIDFKSIEDRKNQYLILGCDGILWMPQIGRNRTVVGDIRDENIFNKINNIVFKNEEV